MSIFVSFASEDRSYVDSFFREADKYKKIDLWVSYEEKISPGKNFKDHIEEAINDSDGAILLISNNFLKSEFVNDFELPLIFNKKKDNPKYKVAPVLLEECNYESNPVLKDLQFVNSPSTNLASVGVRTYSDIVKETIGHFKSLNIRNPILPILLGGIIISFIFSSIGSSNNISYNDSNYEQEESSSNEVETIVKAVEPENISFTEWEVMAELNVLPQKWNEEALIFVTAYMDLDVSAEEFLEIGWASYLRLLDIVAEGMVTYGGLETQEVQALYFPILNNYADKLLAMENILVAIEEGDVDGEIKASEELRAAAEEGQFLSCLMLDALRSPEFIKYLTEQEIASLDMTLAGC